MQRILEGRVLYPNKVPFATFEKCFYVPAIKKKQVVQASPYNYECIVMCSIQPCFTTVTIIDAFLSEKDILLVLNQNSNVTCFRYIEPDLSDGIDLLFYSQMRIY